MDTSSPHSIGSQCLSPMNDSSSRVRHPSSTSIQSNDSWLDPACPRKSANQIDEQRKQLVAYEYLCRLEEARRWLSQCLGEDIPESADLEEELRNGIILAKIANFIFPSVFPLSRIKGADKKELNFRHTDNINYWMQAMERLGLPKIFYPTTTDLYDKKNMPRVVYCVHALSIYLTKLGRGPAITSLVGEAHFTEEEIDHVLKEFERNGIRMPAFTKIDGLLREQLTLDQAAVHAAEVAVYEALEQQSPERVQLCLGNPALDLDSFLVETLSHPYYDTLQTARATKLSQLGVTSEGLTALKLTEIDAYDYILSRAELAQILSEVNEEKEIETRAALRLEIVSKANGLLRLDNPGSHQLLAELLANQDSGFPGVTPDHSVWYYDVMTRARSEKNSDLFWEEMRDLILLANSVALNSKSVESVLLKIDRALSQSSHSSLLLALRSEELDLGEVLPGNVESYFSELLSLREQKRGDDFLSEVEVQACVRTCNQVAGLEALHSLAIQNINNSLISEDADLTLSCLEDDNSRISDVQPELRYQYKHSLSEVLRGRSGRYMSREEIQRSVDAVNSETGLLGKLTQLLEADTEDHEALLSLLQQLIGSSDQLIRLNIPHYRDLLRRELDQSESRLLSSAAVLEKVSEGNRSADLSVQLSQTLIEFNTYLESAVDPADTFQHLLSPFLLFSNLSELCAGQYHKELTRLRARNLSSKSPQQQNIWMECESSDGFPFNYNTQSADYCWRRPMGSEETIDTSLLSNSCIQSVVSSITSISDRELHFTRHLSAVVLIQSYLRMVLGRRKYLATVSHYHQHIPDVVKVQAAVRCHLAMKSYQLIVSASDPPVTSVRKYLPLLEQSERDVQEELELTELKSELVTKIRHNKQLEEDLDNLDTKIGLLVRNRLSVMEVVHTTSKLERRRLAARNHSFKGLQHFNKDSKQLLEGYEHLFYLLQTDPSYFANLIFGMPSGRTTAFMQEVVLTVFNYASTNREHFLLLKLFETALRKEIFSKVEKIDDVIIGNPTVIKLVISFTRRMEYQEHHLKETLGPLVQKVLDSYDRISLSPVDIYKAWLSQTEIETGEPSKYPYEVSSVQALDHLEVRERLSEAMRVVSTAADEFMEVIFSSVAHLPYALRYIASKLGHFLRERFPLAQEEEIGKVIGNLIYYRFLNPVIAAPDAFEVVELEPGATLENEQRKRLGSIARILQHAAARKLFEGEYSCLDALNPYILRSYARFCHYFTAAAAVPSAEVRFGITEYSDLVMISRPVINISAKEIISTHKLLLTHLDAVAPLPADADPLRGVLAELGDTPDIRNLLGELEERNLPAEEVQERWVEMGRQEIVLTLINKYEGISQEKQTLDTSAKFLETKGMVVDLIKVHPGDSLPEIVSAVHSAETERRFDQLMQKSDTSVTPQNRNYTLSELKYFARENLDLLEERGVVSLSDGYQHVLNAIARDIRNQHRYRRERRCEKERLTTAIQQLDHKLAFLDDQYADYKKYVETVTANMSKSGKKVAQRPPADSPTDTSPVLTGTNFKSKTVRYSAQKLFDKGILIEIDGVSRSQFKTLSFEFVSVSHGTFDINAKMLGLPAETVHVVFEDLLQHRFDNVQIMKLLGRVKVNVNLLIYLINKKFYGK